MAAAGFELSEPIQEDYGWELWASRLFHRPDAAALARVRGRVRQALASHSAIRILDDERTA